ncbi:MAG: hypothetical protein ACRCVU_04895 [Flavobacterium sp.]
MTKSRTAEFYAKNPKSKAKKAAYDKKFNAKPEQRKKRSELKVHNERADRRGVDRTGKDASHTKNGIVYKKSSVNRGSKSDSPGDRRARGGKKK